jgi:hypothetical protein
MPDHDWIEHYASGLHGSALVLAMCPDIVNVSRVA